MRKSNNKVLILGGPTGCGESTITKAIISRHSIFQRLVTATSRPLRSGEVNEIDYYFFSKEVFEKKIKEGEILEYTYIENRDSYYGTYKSDLEKKLQDGYLIVNVDYVGVQYYKKNYDSLSIFIKPESVESLAARLRKRNPEISEKELIMRLDNARNEIKNEEKYYDTTVINADGKLDEALIRIENLLKDNGFIV